MEANVTIITKYGFKKPGLTDLKQGELGVDLLGKVLYTRNSSDEIIAVGGGNINWDQINPESFPDEITNIIDGTIELDVLVDLVGDNAIAIKALEADIQRLDGLVAENTRQIGINAGKITNNETDIEDLKGRVTKNEGGILTNSGDIEAAEDRLDDAETKIAKNIQDIEDLQGIVDGDLTGLVLGGTYDVPNNKVSGVTNAGTTAGISVDDKLENHVNEKNSGLYFVCEGEGILGGLKRASSNEKYAQNGDWLVSDGIHGWILMSFGGDHVAWGSIGGDIAQQTDLQDALATKLQEGDTLDGGKFQ